MGNVEGTSEKILEVPVKLEYVAKEGATADTSDATLFIDRKAGRIGVRAPEDQRAKDPSRFQLPLSVVIDLLRKEGL